MAINVGWVHNQEKLDDVILERSRTLFKNDPDMVDLLEYGFRTFLCYLETLYEVMFENSFM